MIRGAMLFFGLTLFGLVGCVSSQGLPAHRDYATVSSYIAAYNERDVQAMSALMHPDVQWLSVEGQDVQVVASGKADLVAQMSAYVSSPSATSSTLEGAVVNGPHLAVREIARWRRDDGSLAEQSSLAVYEVTGGLIRRVWYFPVAR
jgi:hypothetical protein